MWVPQVQPPRVGEQRLAYIEGVIDARHCHFKSACSRFFQHALNLRDMKLGLQCKILNFFIDSLCTTVVLWFRMLRIFLFLFGFTVDLVRVEFCALIKTEELKLRNSFLLF